MANMVATLDDLGRPAWLVIMVGGFILFWPLGLGILAYILWSGRMGCSGYGDMSRFKQRMAARWGDRRRDFERGVQEFAGRGFSGMDPTGNRAFDEYRDQTLRRLEEEAREFKSFLERLRQAKDRSEFDQFMSERRTGEPGGASA